MINPLAHFNASLFCVWVFPLHASKDNPASGLKLRNENCGEGLQEFHSEKLEENNWEDLGVGINENEIKNTFSALQYFVWLDLDWKVSVYKVALLGY